MPKVKVCNENLYTIQRFPPSSHSNNNQVAEKQKETQMQKSPRLLHLPTMLPPTTQAPLTVLPPPYPGPPTDLIYSEGATAGCPPPVGFNYPPVGLNYQGYPPPANLAYPPSTAPVSILHSHPTLVRGDYNILSL